MCMRNLFAFCVLCVCFRARERVLLQGGRMALAQIRHSQIQEERQQHEHAALLLLQVYSTTATIVVPVFCS
jgi:predicted proteasome-type protease